MAQQRSSSGPWIIAGSIVLVGLLAIIASILLLKGTNGTGSPSPSPSIKHSPSRTHTPRPPRSPRPSKSPSPSPSPSPAPSVSPSPTVDNSALVRSAVTKQAGLDRPGELSHVGQPDFYTDPGGCPQTGQAASTTVRFANPPKVGIYIFCKARAHWQYADGPIYGQ